MADKLKPRATNVDNTALAKNNKARNTVFHGRDSAAFDLTADEPLDYSEPLSQQFPDMTAEDLSNILEAFNRFDLDEEGYIDAAKLFKGVELLGYTMTEAEVIELFNIIDKNGNGELEFSEFIELMLKYRRIPGFRNGEMMDMFALLDYDKDGEISVSDADFMLHRLGFDYAIDEVVEIIKAADFNCDGVVTLEDFIKATEALDDPEVLRATTKKPS